jgi:hypothetical protein
LPVAVNPEDGIGWWVIGKGNGCRSRSINGS